jgi:hypothetical protein
MADVFPFEHLSTEIQLQILSSLSFDQILKFSQASKSCYQLSQDEYLWKRMAQQNLGIESAEFWEVPTHHPPISPASQRYRQLMAESGSLFVGMERYLPMNLCSERALEAHRSDLLSHLLKKGCNPDHVLYYALQQHDLSLMEQCLQHVPQNPYAVMEAAILTQNQQYLEIVGKISELQYSRHIGHSIRGDLQQLKQLQDISYWDEILFWAATFGKEEIVDWIIGWIVPRPKYSEIALNGAAYGGKTQILERYLPRLNLDLRVLNQIINYAFLGNKKESNQWLCQHLQSMIQTPSILFIVKFRFGIYFSDLGVIQNLISGAVIGIDLDLRDITPLFRDFACLTSKVPDSWTQLFTQRILNTFRNLGEIPELTLHADKEFVIGAIHSGNLGLVKEWLPRIVNNPTQNGDVIDLLEEAVNGGHLTIVQYLVDRFNNENWFDWNIPGVRARRMRQYRIMEYLENMYDLSYANADNILDRYRSLLREKGLLQ